MARRILGLVLSLLACILSLLGWNGMIQVDHAHYETVDRALINPNADEGAKALYQYLLESYGKRVISGQYINEYEDFSAPQFRVDESDPNSPSTVFKANELRAVYSVTGAYPAMLGNVIPSSRRSSGTRPGGSSPSVGIGWRPPKQKVSGISIRKKRISTSNRRLKTQAARNIRAFCMILTSSAQNCKSCKRQACPSCGGHCTRRAAAGSGGARAGRRPINRFGA